MANDLAWTAEATDATTRPDDAVAVDRAVRDYFEGWYDADAERMRRALHPALSKRSYGQDADRTPALSSLTADQMVAWTAAGEGRTSDTTERALDIRIADLSGSIADVVVHSFDFVEYVHLARTTDGWRVVNTLWRWTDGRGPRVE